MISSLFVKHFAQKNTCIFHVKKISSTSKYFT